LGYPFGVAGVSRVIRGPTWENIVGCEGKKAYLDRSAQTKVGSRVEVEIGMNGRVERAVGRAEQRAQKEKLQEREAPRARGAEPGESEGKKLSI
jgi:hypothetical protein